MNVICRFVWLAAFLGLLGSALTSQACPFCEGEKGPTLVYQFDDAQIVLYGHFENPRITSGGVDQGETDFAVERVLKSHDLIKGKAVLTLPRYIQDAKNKFIIFAEVYKGKLDAHKGMSLTDNSAMLEYLEGAMKFKGRPQSERLRFAFDYLNSPEIEVSLDAYREYARADYRDYKEMAKKLPADKIAGWLQDPTTSAFRYGLYASLLGHCGNAEHAKLLLSMMNDPEKRRGSGLHGLLAAYTMLEPGKGWTMLKDLVQDKDKPFMVRYSGLQTMRFFWDNRPDLVDKSGHRQGDRQHHERERHGRLRNRRSAQVEALGILRSDHRPERQEKLQHADHPQVDPALRAAMPDRASGGVRQDATGTR